MLDRVLLVMALSFISRMIVDNLAAPAKRKFPAADMWWLDFIVMVIGFVLGMLTEANLFDNVEHLMVARVVTSLLIGFGPKAITDVISYVQNPEGDES
jgi:hypothetical protein